MGQQLQLFRSPEPEQPRAPSTWGESRVAAVYEYLKDNPITDRIRAGAQVVAYVQNDNRLWIEPVKGTILSVHTHAINQLCYWLKLPRRYLEGLLKTGAAWSRDLAATNINTLLRQRVTEKNFLLREVGGQLRGMLSDVYKRFDSPRMIDVFSEECLRCNARPYDGFVTDLRVIIQGALPHTYSTQSGSSLNVGVVLKHSDFGVGPLEVRFFIAVNGRTLIGRRGVHRIHRGKRMDEDMEANNAMMGEDSESAAKTIRKLITTHFDQENISAVMAEIEMAEQAEVDPDKVSEVLESLKLNDDELKKAVDAFHNPQADLPQGCTLYRLANVIAWLAKEEDNPGRKLDLMETAGGLVMKERS